MKELILNRIKEIKRAEQGFSRSLMKWQLPLSNGQVVKYADEIAFEELNDHDLLFLFERLLRRHLTQ